MRATLVARCQLVFTIEVFDLFIGRVKRGLGKIISIKPNMLSRHGFRLSTRAQEILFHCRGK
jgi:hypothetical protein